MDLIVWFLAQGIVVEQVVNLLKRVALVAKYPKVAAAALNVAVAVLITLVDVPYAPEMANFLLAVIAGIGAAGMSIGAHEVKPSTTAKRARAKAAGY